MDGRPVCLRLALAGGTLLALAACSDADSGDGGKQASRTDVSVESPAPEVAPIGTYAVGVRTETYVDDSRPTMPAGAFPGAPDRTLLTAIYYPARAEPADEATEGAPPDTRHGPYPLVLFSHGNNARGVIYDEVLTAWASAGYVIAAPDYPLSNTNAPDGEVSSGRADVANQPADASFVLDEILAGDRSGDLLEGIVDPKRIGASGHSLGAVTTFSLVYGDCCTDERVDAALPMSGGGTTNDVDTPLLLQHGDADGTVPYQASVSAFEAASAPKFLVTFTGAGHVSPFVDGQGPAGSVLNRSAVAFWDTYLKDDLAGLERLASAFTDPGVATLREERRG